MSVRAEFEIAGTAVRPGGRVQTEIPIGRLMSGTPVAFPVVAVHGEQDGPTVWLNAASHGDEICGIEIVRRVLEMIDARTMAGTFIAVPILNVHGFNTGDRYLPDRRDLNRSFPGSSRGSLASRIANLMMTEVVERCEVGIDLHTGSDHRANLPQIRGNLDDARTLEFAELFGAPIAMHSKNRDGSLRGAATKLGKTCLLFEGGEAYRFDQDSITVGTDGVLRVLHRLGMIDEIVPPAAPPRISRSSRWVRASSSGIVDCRLSLGDSVEKGEPVAVLRDPLGTQLGVLKSPRTGMLVGRLQHPLVNRGDAILHIAALEDG
ncbi:MAG: succinylglutamate desuccinylase/aspartoacylase family protein [Actinomycetota bacterium]